MVVVSDHSVGHPIEMFFPDLPGAQYLFIIKRIVQVHVIVNYEEGLTRDVFEFLRFLLKLQVLSITMNYY